LKKTHFDFLISFLMGASWAITVLGAIKLFSVFLPFGIFAAITAGFIGSLFGLFLVMIVGLASIQAEKLSELKRQTKLLETLLQKRPKGSDSSDDIVSDNR
jgi:hypothetical protein